MRRTCRIALTLFTVGVLAPSSSVALSSSAYLEALQIAQAHVERASGGGIQVNGLAPMQPTHPWLQHSYKVGESWKVSVTGFDTSAMRMTGEAPSLAAKRERTSVFVYEVLSFTEGKLLKLRIREEGKKIDSRVKAIELTLGLDRTPTQLKKVYQLGHREFEASPEGMRAPVSYLELLPLDAPELSAAVSSPASAPLTTKFEFDDFFGRKVEAEWKSGDPWPRVLSTSNGRAILLEVR